MDRFLCEPFPKSFGRSWRVRFKKVMFVAEVINVAKNKSTAKVLCGQHPQSIGIFVLVGSVEGPRRPAFC